MRRRQEARSVKHRGTASPKGITASVRRCVCVYAQLHKLTVCLLCKRKAPCKSTTQGSGSSSSSSSSSR
eukprot:142135-Chlamydomonas_euryale.AAC.2